LEKLLDKDSGNVLWQHFIFINCIILMYYITCDRYFNLFIYCLIFNSIFCFI